MKIEECYEQMGANYAEVLGRLRSEALIRKFMLLFPKDPTYQELKQAIENQSGEDAFRAAHTLKGVSQNLGFDNLYRVSAELAEIFRDRTLDGSEEKVKEVDQEYKKTIDAIQAFAAEM